MASQQPLAWEITLAPDDPTVSVGVKLEQPIPGVALDVPAVTIGWSHAAAPWAVFTTDEARAVAGGLATAAEYGDDIAEEREAA